MKKTTKALYLCLFILVLVITSAAVYQHRQAMVDESTVHYDMNPTIVRFNGKYYTSSIDNNTDGIWRGEALGLALQAQDFIEAGVIKSYEYSYDLSQDNCTNDPMYVDCKVFFSESVPGFLFIQYEREGEIRYTALIEEP